MPDPFLEEWFKKGPEIGDQLTIRAVKLYADGALGSRGAWLIDSYLDRPEHYGNPTLPIKVIEKIAEKENIDIRLYSIIYDAINEVKDAMEGMLSAEMKEQIVGSAEIRETFKISKIGTIAGCMVTEGKIGRSNDIRLIRDGVVIYTGLLGSLKRFKDDAKEVAKGYDCGLNIKNYNDIRIGDIVEAFEHIEVKRTLD